MDYNIKNLKMIARGGQAEIYDIGDNKVLRVLINPNDEESLKNEMKIMKSLKSDGVCVPGVYEYLTIEGRPAIIIDKIMGESMLDYMGKHPLKMRKEIQSLAALHVELGKIRSLKDLNSAKGRARYLIERSTFLDSNLKQFTGKLLDELPEGDSLCHGDFHPGNILKSGEKNYIIDWFGAFKGDILSDAAHSYLIMKNVPRLPGEGRINYIRMKFLGSILAKEYITSFNKLNKFDWGDFSKWMVIKAAERTYYGFPVEKPALIKFIEYCYKQSNKGESADKWYKGI